MIPKIICFLFGHEFWYKNFFKVKDGIKYWDMQLNEVCPRCGKKLLASKQHEE